VPALGSNVKIFGSIFALFTKISQTHSGEKKQSMASDEWGILRLRSGQVGNGELGL
jgi:hypothetical protein